MKKANLLLVDDETSFMETMTKRLEKRNYRVTTAASGEDALAWLEQHHRSVDVVVLDVRMPGMSGNETLAAIKARFPLVEVIMLTGHGTVQSAVAGLKQGAFDYLMKPCELDRLTERVAGAVAMRKARAEGAVAARVGEIARRRA